MYETTIRSQLQKSRRELGQEPFLAAAVWCNPVMECFHAGLLLSLPGKAAMVLEYTGTEIEYKPLDSYKGDVILFNKLNGVRTDNVNYLAAHFRSVKKYAGPYIKYGFFFPPARFLKDGNYYSEINAPFLTTCVGFCLMVLNGLLSPEVFIETEAWKTASEASRTYLKTFQKLSRRVSVADAVNFKPHIKRVLPIEYFAASFLKQRKREHILAWKKVLQKVLH